MHYYFASRVACGYITVLADDDVLSNSTEVIDIRIETGNTRGAIHSERAMLHTFQFLKEFSSKHIELIEKSCVVKRYAADDFLVHEGEHSTEIYFLTKGQVVLSKKIPETNSQVEFKKMAAGQTFGEMSFMDGSPRSCSVQAMDEVEAYCLDKQRLLESGDEAETVVEHLQITIQYQVNEYLRHLSDRHTATLYKRIQELEAEEAKLKKQVEQLRIEIDEVKFEKRITEIVETDFFQDLAEKSQVLRENSEQRKQATKARGV